MDLPNHPVSSPSDPIAPPPLGTPEIVPEIASAVASLPLPEASPGDPIPSPSAASDSPNPRVASTLATDMIASVQSLMGTVIIAIFVITFIVQAFQIPSESMENTLLVGDYLLVNKLCYGGAGVSGLGFGDPVMPYQKIARGDVIVFHYPVDPKQHFVKRVIGLPGDRLRMINKKVWINGKPLDEPYVRFLEPPNNMFRDNFPRTDLIAPGEEGKWWQEMRKLVEDGQLIIPEGHYFAMGDNRDDSQDSRYWGFVPRENIIGRPLLIYWSVKTWQDPRGTATVADRLLRVAYGITHIFQITRWNRTLRLVH